MKPFIIILSLIILIYETYMKSVIAITFTLLFLKIFNIIEIDLVLCFVPLMIAIILHLLYLIIIPEPIRQKLDSE